MILRIALGACGWARGVLLLIAGLAVAAAISRDALIAARARAQPNMVLQLEPTNAVALNAAFRRSLSRGVMSSDQLRLWAERAAAALRDAPLSAAIIRMVATDPGRTNADQLLHLAERASRRDALLQLALIETAVRENRIGEALDHYDRALSIYPDMRGVLFPVLANAVMEADVRTSLMQRPRARRPWMIPFLSYAVAHTPSSTAVSALLDGMRDPRRGAIDVRDQEAAFAGRLMGLGDYAAARLAARRAAGANADAIDRVGFSSATWAASLRPLTWAPGGAEGIDAQLEGDGSVTVTAAPGSSGTALLRILMPPPGRYRFTAAGEALADGASGVTGRWTLSCLRDNGRVATPLGELVLDSAARSAGERVVDVPAACGAVRLILAVDNLDGGTEAGLAVRDVAFAPVG